MNRWAVDVEREGQGHAPQAERLKGAIWVLIVSVVLGGATRAQGAPELRQVQSTYYLIHSDLDNELIYDLGMRMDAMYAEYSRRMSDFDLREDRKPLDVYLFGGKGDYLRFTK